MRKNIHHRFLAIFLIFSIWIPVLSGEERTNTPLLLAKTYSQENLSLWWVSEKLDGVRGIWDGQNLRFRSGRKITAPEWFTAPFPKQKMDGELWMGRGTFEALSGTVRKKSPNPVEWKKVRYMLFELPESDGTFTQRVEKMRQLTESLKIPWLQMIPQFRVKSESELMQKLEEVVQNGGEGLMLHRADSRFHGGRSDDLLKLKKWQDAEAKVLEILPGKGKFQGMMGALKVRDMDGNIFKIGSGYSLQMRENPPPPGSIITFKYTGRTSKGKPKFTSFLRIRPQE